MSRMTSEQQRPPYQPRPQGYEPPVPPAPAGLSAGGLITGLVVLGVGAALLWNYLGPDLRRYLKIRNM